MRKTSVLFVGLPLVALFAASIDCNKMREKAEEEAIEHATGGKAHIDHDGKGITLTSPDGGTSAAWGGAAKVPDGFPTKRVPIYPGSKVLTSMSTSDPKGGAYTVILESTDAPDQIAAYYKTNLSSLKSNMDMTQGINHVMNFEDPTDKLVVNLIIGGDANAKKSSVSLSVGHN